MSALRRRLPAILLATTILWASGAALAVAPATAENGSKIPASSPSTPGTKLACLKKGSLHYTGKVKPRGTCEIGGLVESSYAFYEGSPEGLGRGGSFARFPIEGPFSEAGARERITWLEWGSSFNLGLGTNARNGHFVNLTLYRRVRCRDGSTWYSRADVTDSEIAVAFYLRLPVCGSRPALGGGG
jgi:hypothetical protein